jgi:penicillin amidase
MVVALIVVAAIVVALLAVAVRWLRRPLPHTRGRLVVDGVRGEVTVVRDRRGVAHVDAATMEDAAFAMGLVHAQERLWQLDLGRRVASGRISEIAGGAGLPADRFLRRVGLRRIAVREAELLDGETRRMLEAYAAGVNVVISSGRALPVEFSLLRIRPEPWRPVDSIACAKLLALGLSTNWDAELQRLRLLIAVGPETAARLHLVYPESNPTILADTVRDAGPNAGSELLELYRGVAPWLPSSVGASNAWALAPARTASGRPLLCNDPHLEPSVPSVWFAAHVRAGDDFESTGVTFAGQPFPLIGHNRSVAWGFTNSFVDAQDLVIEQFDSADATRHRTEEGWRDSHVVREVIRVKDASDEVEEVVITRHGPVVERCDDPASGRWLGLALQWTAHTPACASAAVLALQRATDWGSFRAAFDSLDAPSQNAVYADVDGHIGYFCCARVPVRRQAASPLPAAGWEGDRTWVRFLSRDEVPQCLDPADGAVVTANNRIVGDGFPHHVSFDYMAGYRARRIADLLEGDGLDAQRMRAIQLDTLSLPAAEVARLLAEVRCDDPHAEAMRLRLVAWDGRMDPRRVEPTMFEAFMLHLAEHALRPLCGDFWGIAAGVTLTHPVFTYPGNVIGRATPLLLESWAAGDESLLDGLATWPEVAERALDDAVADLAGMGSRESRRRWGHVHRMPLTHPLAVRRLLAPLLNAPSISVGGSVDTVMATAARPGQDFATRAMAPSWRQVFDVGAWEAGCTGVLYPGQSGHRASRHHHDLSRDWVTNRQFTLAWGDAAFRRGRRLILAPRSRALITAGQPA